MAHTPQKITLHRKLQELELVFGDQATRLSAEFLRVHSPSAEVRGHGEGQQVLQHGKMHVGISRLIPCGNYALQIIFDDGHDSGIYSWEYLAELCNEKEQIWQAYLDALSVAGLNRDPNVQVIELS